MNTEMGNMYHKALYTLCTAGLILVLSTLIRVENTCWAGQILLDPIPETLPPQTIDRDQATADQEVWLQERRVTRQQQYDLAHPRPSQGAILEAQFKARPPTPQILWMKWDLLIPGIQTDGSRQHYTIDPTVQLSWGVRLTQQRLLTEGLHIWGGLRSVYFSGSGVHKGLPGRYGFSYGGPLVSIAGYTSTPVLTTYRLGAGSVEDLSFDPPLSKIYGWMLSLGVGVMSKAYRGLNDPGRTYTDFSTTHGARSDQWGAWTQIEGFVLYLERLGVHGGLGTQKGDGKWFYWVHLGVSGWH